VRRSCFTHRAPRRRSDGDANGCGPLHSSGPVGLRATAFLAKQCDVGPAPRPTGTGGLVPLTAHGYRFDTQASAIAVQPWWARGIADKLGSEAADNDTDVRGAKSYAATSLVGRCRLSLLPKAVDGDPSPGERSTGACGELAIMSDNRRIPRREFRETDGSVGRRRAGGSGRRSVQRRGGPPSSFRAKPVR
jgi:hypothetical protein